MLESCISLTTSAASRSSSCVPALLAARQLSWLCSNPCSIAKPCDERQQVRGYIHGAGAQLTGACVHGEQIREIRLDFREATGPCKARALAQALWAGEAYVLQVDAHMRFGPGWDECLVRWLAQAEAATPHGRAVLSTYPPSYEVRAACCSSADFSSEPSP